VSRSGGFILRDAAWRPLLKDEVLQTLMAMSAAKPRVSNHEARWMRDYDSTQPENTLAEPSLRSEIRQVRGSSGFIGHNRVCRD
jgi:hypothetical protein